MAKLVNVRTKEEYPLRGDVVVIGRLPSCDIRVLEKQVSRRHCRLVRSPQGWIISDAGSMLGTYVNGELLMQPHRLEQGDEVRVGTEVFTFDTRPAGREKLRLKPISKAAPGELVPGDRLVPRTLKLAAAGAATLVAIIGGFLLFSLIPQRQTPARLVRQAARLVREQDARQLRTLLAEPLRKKLPEAQLLQYLASLPKEAREALRQLRVGPTRPATRGERVHVSLLWVDEELTGEVLCVREGDHWRILDAPIDWLKKLTISTPGDQPQ